MFNSTCPECRSENIVVLEDTENAQTWNCKDCGWVSEEYYAK